MITAKYGIPSASPGAMFRAEMAAGTKLGIAADQLTRHGKLVPDDLVCSVVAGWLATHDGEFVFDGFPRSLGQASVLASMLTERKTPLDVALFLKADFATIANRVESRVVCSKCHANFSLGLHVTNVKSDCPKCGGKLVRRTDDNIETLQLRMREYREKTEPVVAYYGGLGLLKTVDSTRTQEVVFKSIADVLEDR